MAAPIGGLPIGDISPQDSPVLSNPSSEYSQYLQQIQQTVQSQAAPPSDGLQEATTVPNPEVGPSTSNDDPLQEVQRQSGAEGPLQATLSFDAVDTGKGLLAGIGHAAKETFDTVANFANKSILLPRKVQPGLTDLITGAKPVNYNKQTQAEFDNLGISYLGPNGGDLISQDVERYLNVLDAQTTPGRIVQTISQTAASMIGVSKVLKAAGVLQGAGAAMTAGRGVVEGTLAQTFSFDEHDKRLSNYMDEMLEGKPGLAKDVAHFLAQDDNDSFAMAKLKSAIENTALSVGVETGIGIFKHLKAFRKLKAAGDMEGALKEVERAGDELGKINAQAAPGTAEAIDAITAPPSGQAGMDLTFPQVRKPTEVKPFDPAELKVYQEEYRKNLEAGVDPNDNGLFSNLNLNYVDGLSDARESIEAIFKARKAEFDALKSSGKMSTKEAMDKAKKYVTEVAAEHAEITSRSLDDVMQEIANGTSNDVLEANLKMLATGDYMAAVFNKMQKLGDKISSGFATVDEERSYESMLNTYAEVTASYTEIGSEAGRILRNRQVTHYGDLVENLKTRGYTTKQIAEHLKMVDNPNALKKLLTETGKVLDMFGNALAEYYINNLLWSPKTHVVNAFANTMMTGQLAVEKTLGGAVTFQPGVVREGVDQMLGLQRFFMDSLKMAGIALRNEEPILKSGTHSLEFPKGIGAKPFNRGEGSVSGTTANWLGNLVRIPTRALGASDEFYLQINYRSIIWAKALRAGRMVGLDGSDLISYAHEQMNATIDKNGAAIAKGLNANDSSVLEAQAATMSKDFDQDDGVVFQFVRGISAIRNSIDGALNQLSIPGTPGRMVVPFLRVATNIGQDIVDHIPLSPLVQASRRDALLGGGDKAAGVAGQQTVGALYAGIGVWLASQNLITGSGPADIEKQKELQDTIGWQPNSIMVPTADGKQLAIGYGRFDPQSSYTSLASDFFGLAADFVQVYPHLDEEEAFTFAWEFAASIGKNLANKKFLQGINDILQAVADPGVSGPTKMRKIVETLQVGTIPAGSLVNFFNNDSVMREPKNLIEKFKTRLPGQSTQVAPHRNIFGEEVINPNGLKPFEISPIMDTRMSIMGKSASVSQLLESVTPVTLSSASTPLVYNELKRQIVKYDHKLSTLPDKDGNLDLTQFRNKAGQNAADFRREQMAIVNARPGVNFRGALEQLFKDPVYNNASEDAIVHWKFGTAQYVGLKWSLVLQLKKDYESLAKAKLQAQSLEFLGPDGSTLANQIGVDAVNKSAALIPKSMQGASGIRVQPVISGGKVNPDSLTEFVSQTDSAAPADADTEQQQGG